MAWPSQCTKLLDIHNGLGLVYPRPELVMKGSSTPMSTLSIALCPLFVSEQAEHYLDSFITSTPKNYLGLQAGSPVSNEMSGTLLTTCPLTNCNYYDKAS